MASFWTRLLQSVGETELRWLFKYAFQVPCARRSPAPSPSGRSPIPVRLRIRSSLAELPYIRYGPGAGLAASKEPFWRLEWQVELWFEERWKVTATALPHARWWNICLYLWLSILLLWERRDARALQNKAFKSRFCQMDHQKSSYGHNIMTYV